MSYRARMQSRPETLAEFELAWEHRLTEGLLLLKDEATRTGGVYLLGYVAEMILKVAYFRFIGAASEDRLDLLFAQSGFRAAVNSSPVVTENFHSLKFWTELLLTARQQRNRQLPAHLTNALRHYTDLLYDNWQVDMRYSSLIVAAQEWQDAQKAAFWFYHNHDSLWR